MRGEVRRLSIQLIHSAVTVHCTCPLISHSPDKLVERINFALIYSLAVNALEVLCPLGMLPLSSAVLPSYLLIEYCIIGAQWQMVWVNVLRELYWPVIACRFHITATKSEQHHLGLSPSPLQPLIVPNRPPSVAHCPASALSSSSVLVVVFFLVICSLSPAPLCSPLPSTCCWARQAWALRHSLRSLL